MKGLLTVTMLAALLVIAAVKIWDLFDRLGNAERSIKQLNSAHSEPWDRIRKVESSR